MTNVLAWGDSERVSGTHEVKQDDHAAHAEPGQPAVESEPEYTIDELAAASRVPSRTIRFYQSKGALPGPQIRGRVAYYGKAHVERLELIASLQDRGLSIRAIRDLLAQVDKGELSLGEWLGLEDRLKEPWADDRPRIVTETELHQMIGDRRPGLVSDLSRLGLVERQGHGFMVRSPALLHVALQLEKSGIDVETGAIAQKILRKHLSRAAEELTKFFFEKIGDGFGRKIAAEDISAAFAAIRPQGLEAVRVVFSQEMEKSLGDLVASGKTSEIPAKAKRRR